MFNVKQEVQLPVNHSWGWTLTTSLRVHQLWNINTWIIIDEKIQNK